MTKHDSFIQSNLLRITGYKLKNTKTQEDTTNFPMKDDTALKVSRFAADPRRTRKKSIACIHNITCNIIKSR